MKLSSIVKTEILKNSRLLPVCLLMLFAGVSCVDDHLYDGQGGATGAEKAVTFALTLPGQSSGGRTYALEESDEKQVNSIEVLLFARDENYVETRIVPKAEISGEENVKTFTVKIPEGTYSSLVILANSYDIVFNANLSTSDTKEDVLKKLNVSNSGKWVTDKTSNSYKAIPMWGELGETIVGKDSPVSLALNLTRMLAKVSVALSTPAATDNFQLKTIDVYNYYDKGSVAPLAENWDSDRATGASVPAGAAKPDVTTPYTTLTYSDSEITEPGVASINEIYLFESDNSSQTDLLDRTCLVLGGTYSDGNTYYYRVDFVYNSNETDIYRDILRNHHYKFNVTKISGPGYDAADKAFNARPFNIEATVTDWEETLITDIVFDGQYMLGVSKGEFTFSREARTEADTDNTLWVTTDFPEGWKVDKIVDEEGESSTWLSTNISSGEAKDMTKIKLCLSENDSGEDRKAFIHLKLKTGRLTYIVKVCQNIIVSVGISITDAGGNPVSVLEFAAEKGVQPAAQQFTLDWKPAAFDLFFTLTPMENPFTFAFGSDTIPASGSLSDGTKTYTIRPSAITEDPFYERSSVVFYRVFEEMTTVTKTLTLRQFVPTILPKVESHYLMDGSRKSFPVRSNMPFKVTVKENPDNVISNIETTGVPDTGQNGTPVIFDIVDGATNPTLNLRNVVLTISSLSSPFTSIDITLRCVSGIFQPESNSYIVAPGARGIMIPVSRANKSDLGTQLRSSEDFTAEMIWTDNSNRIGADASIQTIATVGTGPDGHVLVAPGSASGNAVVAIKNTAGKILWSWHIWVTSYSPDSSSKFMDRNLGALSNIPPSDVYDISSKGLFYQWGRKDPFPGSTSHDAGNERDIYNNTGKVSVLKEQVSVPNNLANSVANPLKFYYDEYDGPRDWYSNAGLINNDLWSSNPAPKTVYDPSPEGWRIPEQSDWSEGFPEGGFDPGEFGTEIVAYGFNWPDYGGFYLFEGARSPENGDIVRITANFYPGSLCWTTNTAIGPSGTLSHHLAATAWRILPGVSTAPRASGYNIRCVRDSK